MCVVNKVIFGLHTWRARERELIMVVWGYSLQRGPGAEPLVRGSGAKHLISGNATFCQVSDQDLLLQLLCTIVVDELT